MTEILDSMLGGGGALTYYGQGQEVMLAVSGADAERLFAETADRLQSRRKKGGLTAETFSPLEAGAGFYATFDVARFDSLSTLLGVVPPVDEAEDEAERETEKEESGPPPVVFGARSEQDALALDLALPTELLLAWFEDEAEQEEGLPPGLWPTRWSRATRERRKRCARPARRV
jgi:hypothetical protein